MDNTELLIKTLLSSKEPFTSMIYTQLLQKGLTDDDIVFKAIELGFIKRTEDATSIKRKNKKSTPRS